MIVRPQMHSHGRQGWLLITQQDHARLAGDLARNWLPLQDFVDPLGLQAAIDHHDDGWHAWDASPGVRPQTKLPRDFLHMPLTEAIPLWTSSITQAEAWGPLCQYVVSAHFSALLERSQAVEQPSTQAEAESFLRQEELRRRQTLLAWQQLNSRHSNQAADWAVHCVQFFDRFSLWLCCGQDDRATQLPDPDQAPLHLTPTSSGEIFASPWNWDSPAKHVTVRGVWLPDGAYHTTDDVLRSLEPYPELSWRFAPSDNNT